MLETINIPPHAASLMHSLRDIGYELDTALADLIDNSITANSKNISVFFDINPETKVAIIDDGYGFSEKELEKAMTIGSDSPLNTRSDNDLGRFGLGLKTASFSQCKRLTVITINKQSNDFVGMCWDLDEVTAKNEWSLIKLSNDQIASTYQIDKLVGTGTLVVWEKCDRLHEQDERSNDYHLYQKFKDAEVYLSLVFHRFLDKSYRAAPNIDIVINCRKIDFIDPFFRHSLATQIHNQDSIQYKNQYIKIQGYTLPHHSKCTKDEYEKHSLGSYRDTQGFFVYRANRLLIAGNWFRLIKKSDLTALTRVEIDLPNSFDSEWHIDIKKSHAKPPSQIKDQLKQYIDTFISGSKRVYNSKGYRKNIKTTPLWHQYTNKNLKSYLINRQHPLIEYFINKLDVKDSSQFKEILSLIEQNFPVDQLFADYAASPKDFKSEYSDSEIESMAIRYLEKFSIIDLDTETIINFLKMVEPYSFYKGDWNLFLKDINRGN